MKSKKLMLSLAVVLLFSLSPFLNKSASADDRISIGVFPNDTLFQVENMKPGDWAPRTVTVENNGQEAFSYSMHIESESTDKLFNELLLEIKTPEIELYTGKLADFENLEERNLERGEEENLELTIRFPSHLGNEFQGLNTAFNIIFTAKGDLDDAVVQVPGFIGSDEYPPSENGSSPALGSSDTPSHSGGTLPQTATDIFLFLLLGAVLLINGILLYKYNQQRKRA